jgi:hypothetical protein
MNFVLMLSKGLMDSPKYYKVKKLNKLLIMVKN